MTFEEFAIDRLDRLLASATAICGDRRLAEDVVQDVLVKVHARWSRIDVLDNRDAYVRTMMVNEFLSWRRKWSRVTVTANLPDTGSSEDPFTGLADRDQLRGALTRLPRQQQVVLALRYYEDLDDTEIAAVLGCAAGTVRGYASRAMASLRADLGTDVEGAR